MAKATFSANIVASGNAEATIARELVASVVKTATDTAVGVLVADGAAPTQAHVNDLAAAWATLEAAIDAAVAQVSGNLVITIDNANITTLSKLRKALRAIEAAAEASGQFTP